jgi:hypothetical protein
VISGDSGESRRMSVDVGGYGWEGIENGLFSV